MVKHNATHVTYAITVFNTKITMIKIYFVMFMTLNKVSVGKPHLGRVFNTELAQV